LIIEKRSSNQVLFCAQANRTAFLTLAELNQNVTTNYTLFNWELSYGEKIDNYHRFSCRHFEEAAFPKLHK